MRVGTSTGRLSMFCARISIDLNRPSAPTRCCVSSIALRRNSSPGAYATRLRMMRSSMRRFPAMSMGPKKPIVPGSARTMTRARVASIGSRAMPTCAYGYPWFCRISTARSPAAFSASSVSVIPARSGRSSCSSSRASAGTASMPSSRTSSTVMGFSGVTLGGVWRQAGASKKTRAGPRTGPAPRALFVFRSAFFVSASATPIRASSLPPSGNPCRAAS